MALPSALLEEPLDFTPSAATLDAIETVVQEASQERALRREALGVYERSQYVASAPLPQGWRHDYNALPPSGLGWSPEATATLPPGAASDETASFAGALFHVGTTVLAPRDERRPDPRIVVAPLSEALQSHATLVESVRASVVDWRRDRFAALATAFRNCGAFVYVPAGVQLDAPIVLAWTQRPGEPEAVFPHIVVMLGEGARATVIEQHLGDGDGEPFVCGIVEVQLAARAKANYVVQQQAGEGARVLMHRGARCAEGASVTWSIAELGGTLVRSVVEAQLEAAGSNAEIAALFFNSGWQHVDLTSEVDHSHGHTTSQTVVRSAAIDHGQGRYLGNIAIRAGAHGSDASLRDDALLLSRTAHIDSVPALEIAANDVKAFHGATVGSLDEEEIFYVQSRGIARHDAVRMVALGFFEPAIALFPGESLREAVRTALDEKLDAATDLNA